MPEIRADDQPVTQITVVESEPDRQAEAPAPMSGRPRVMARQPGCVPISLHRYEVVHVVDGDRSERRRVA